MEIQRVINPSKEVIKGIAQIHISVLTESFLNNFGLNFLEIIYKNLLQSKDSILITSSENETLTGFLLAVTDYSTFFKTAVSNDKPRLVIITLKTLLNKPYIIYKLISSLLKFSKEEPHAELQFIAVLPKYQGQNLGTKLVEQLNTELIRIGIKKYFVGTKSSNELSNKFYRKLGFTKSHTKKYFGDELNYYISPD